VSMQNEQKYKLHICEHDKIVIRFPVMYGLNCLFNCLLIIELVEK